MQKLTWYLFADYAFCGAMGFILRLLIDWKKDPKPFWMYQLAASVAISFLAYIMYGFYGINKAPMELWIMASSFMGAFIVTTFDYIAKNNISTYFNKVATQLLALTSKYKKDEK